jgi:flagellar hook-associated protein 3 FlgL
MEGASSLRFTLHAQTDIRRITTELADLQKQISSGKKAHDLASYGGASGRLLTASTMKAAIDTRGAIIDQLGGRLNLQALSLNKAASSARDLALTIREALAAGDGRGITTGLEFAFAGIVESLNQMWDGQPLFAGERQNESPIMVTTLTQLAAAVIPQGVFNESVRPQVLDLGDGQAIQLAAKASEISQGVFQDLQNLKALVDAFGGSIGQPISTATAAQLLAIATSLESNANTITNEEGRTGRLQARLEAERTKLTRQSDLLAKEFSDQADADLAEVSIKLNVLMAQYEATAKTFSDLSKLTLLDYL